MAKKITALPSVILMPEGNEKELDLCSLDEKDDWRNKICRQIGVAVSEQYIEKPWEWNSFVAKMLW